MVALIRGILLGGVGGLAGGAAVGLAEAAVVAAVSGLTEYWVFVSGATSYGVLGGLLGAGWGSLTVWNRAVDDARRMASSAALVVTGLGVVVARFRIIRDVFGESLPLASAAGLAVHAGLLVGGMAVFLAVRRAFAASAYRHGSVKTPLVAAFGIAGLSLVATVVFNLARGAQVPPELAQPARARGPNVLLIIVDTLRADYVGAYGGGKAQTPALDGLAGDGVVFENAFAQSSWTRPSIATILTSLYAGSHSVMHKTDLLPDEVTTLAEAMGEAGYRTVGFVTNINLAPSFGFDQGFDQYSYLAPDFFFGATDSGSKLSLYSAMRLIRERFLSRKKWVNHYYQDAATVNATTLPWLDSQRGAPFFALVHYMDPHDPYFEIPYNGRAIARVDTPNPAAERAPEMRALYTQNVEYVDGFLKVLFDSLRAAGAYDDTLILLVADHGEEFHEHGGWWHGTTLYDEQLRVPFIVKLAGGVRAGTRSRELVGLVDVMPTVLAASGVEILPACQGRDLFGPTPAPLALYAEEDHEGNVLESIRTAEWKLVLANAGNPRGLAEMELYHLPGDPAELRNLADSRTDQLAALRANLAVLRQAARARAVSGVSGDIDAGSKERLRALGYME